MNDNFNNDKWTEKAVWIKKEPLSSDAVLDDVRAIITAIDVYQNNLKMSDFEKLSRQTRDDLNNIVEMKIKLSEHFS